MFAPSAHRRHKESAADCHPPLHLLTVAAFGRKPLNFHAPGGSEATLEQPWARHWAGCRMRRASSRGAGWIGFHFHPRRQARLRVQVAECRR